MGRKTDIAEKFAKYLRGNMNDGLAIVINKETTHVDLLDMDCDAPWESLNFNQIQVKVEGGNYKEFLSSCGDKFVFYFREDKNLLKIEKFIGILDQYNVKTVVI